MLKFNTELTQNWITYFDSLSNESVSCAFGASKFQERCIEEISKIKFREHINSKNVIEIIKNLKPNGNDKN